MRNGGEAISKADSELHWDGSNQLAFGCLLVSN